MNIPSASASVVAQQNSTATASAHKSHGQHPKPAVQASASPASSTSGGLLNKVV